MYTDVELMKVLESVEKEFNTHLAKAEEASQTTLSKSEDKPMPPKEEKKPEGKEGEQKPEDKKPEGQEQGKEEPKAAEGQPPQAAEGEQKPEHKPEGQPEGQAAAQPQHGGDESHGYDDEDMQHMHKMYMSMSKAELKAHHDSVRAALDSQGMQKCEAPMAKSETDATVAAPAVQVIDVKIPELEKETALLKSELASEKEKVTELQKKVDLAAEFMGKLAAKKAAPQGKAITSLEVIQKSETSKEEKKFSNAEITEILNKKVGDVSLSKSDREAINDYYLGSKDIKIVRHLLA